MIKSIFGKLTKSLLVVAPITIVILIVSFFAPTTSMDKINLILSFILLIVGNTLFENGANMSMIGIGESVGNGLCRTKKIWLMLIISFLIGFIISFAEPDLQVFAGQVAKSFPGINNTWMTITIVSLGVGIFFALSVIKTLFKLSTPAILILSYLIVFVLSLFVPSNLIGMCFDSGSVTTGPISVPFIIAFGLGISSVLWRNKKDDDEFGMVALCSVGPIIAMMIMALFVKDTTLIQTTTVIENLNFMSYLLHYLKDVAFVVLPILIIYIIFQSTIIKFPKKMIHKTLVGILFTYIGIVLFLTGVSFGYLPLASKFGIYFGKLENKVWAYLLAALLGFCCVLAEPAIQILKKQIKEITGGSIKQWSVVLFVALGVGLSVILSVLMVHFSINVLWFLIPVLIASLILALINTSLFTAISFDSGGVATGTMAVSFILPFVNGFATSIGIGSGFGTIALIASMPILTMQILGLIFKIKLMKSKPAKSNIKNLTVSIINFDWEV